MESATMTTVNSVTMKKNPCLALIASPSDDFRLVSSLICVIQRKSPLRV
jgi:hypothetical protein